MKIGIVTGASSGLGREFLHQMDLRFALDEIWAIARRTERLEQLRREFEENPLCRSRIRPIPLDLLDKASVRALQDLLEQEQPDVKILVNAAGFGRVGLCTELPLGDHENMIDLNCRAAVDVTMVTLPYLRKGSRLLNICSVAAYQPLSGLNTYTASKAFLLSWTKALRLELLGSGIHVTAVCPYWLKDTEFIPTARKNGSGAVRNFFGAERAKTAARWALQDNAAGLWVSSCSPISLFLRFFSKFIPHIIISPIWDVLRRIGPKSSQNTEHTPPIRQQEKDRSGKKEKQ